MAVDIPTVARSAVPWLIDRGGDAARWAVDLVRHLPIRLRRLGGALVTLAAALGHLPVVAMGISVRRAKAPPVSFRDAGLRLLRGVGAFVAAVFDLFGGPEILELLNRAIAGTTPLTPKEVAAAASVLGDERVRFGIVRVARGGLLSPIFRINGRRAFTVFHTVNVPSAGHHVRANTAIVVHELVHVYQYERVGSIYIAQALYAQATSGYDYGGPEGLDVHRAAGREYRDFNREQQAQIAQEYYVRREQGEDVSRYEPYIEELVAGRI